MIIEELPTGSVLVFVLTTLISWFFQLPGFILSYLLHTTHAGRFGSQAGLALTLIQWGLGSTVMGSFPPPDGPPPPPPPPGPDAGGPPGGGLPFGGENPEDGMMRNSTMMDGNGSALADMEIPYSGHEWVSFFLMTIGPSFLSSVSARRFACPWHKTNLRRHDNDRLVPASHVLDWLFPRETIRIVRPRIAHYPFIITSNVSCRKRRRSQCGVAAEFRGRFWRRQRRVRLGFSSGGCICEPRTKPCSRQSASKWSDFSGDRRGAATK